MGSRSGVLWDIKKALRERGIWIECDSIKDLKRAFPRLVDENLRSFVDLSQLMLLIESCDRQELDRWRIPIVNISVSKSSQMIRNQSIYSLHLRGMSNAELGREFTISRQHVGEVIKKMRSLDL